MDQLKRQANWLSRAQRGGRRRRQQGGRRRRQGGRGIMPIRRQKGGFLGPLLYAKRKFDQKSLKGGFFPVHMLEGIVKPIIQLAKFNAIQNARKV